MVRFRKPEERFSRADSADRSFKYPIFDRPVPYGATDFIDNTDIENGIAVGIGHQESTSWVELCRPNKGTGHPNLVELNIINEARLSQPLGRTALLDSLILPPGVGYTVGRNTFPLLARDVSRTHASFETTNSGVYVTDMESTFGTRVYLPRPRSAPGDSDSGSSDDEQEEADMPRDTVILRAETMMDKYGDKYPSLTIVEYAICITALEHLMAITDANIRSRQFNRRFHPDIKNELPPSVRDEIYKLMLELLA